MFRWYKRCKQLFLGAVKSFESNYYFQFASFFFSFMAATVNSSSQSAEKLRGQYPSNLQDQSIQHNHSSVSHSHAFAHHPIDKASSEEIERGEVAQSKVQGDRDRELDVFRRVTMFLLHYGIEAHGSVLRSLIVPRSLATNHHVYVAVSPPPHQSSARIGVSTSSFGSGSLQISIFWPFPLEVPGLLSSVLECGSRW